MTGATKLSRHAQFCGTIVTFAFAKSPGTMARSSAISASRKPFRLATWLALLAFLLQGVIVQSHIHVATIAAASVPAQQGQHPDQKAPAECPACQLYAATAAVLMPHVVADFLPLSWVASHFHNLSAPPLVIARHLAWQSRAPPQL